MTPLIDVVFLLLIFFLLAGTFVAPVPFPIDPPATDFGSGEAGPDIVVYVGEGGRVAFNDGSGSLTEFETRLRERVALGTVDSVTIQADRSVPSGLALEILRRTEQAGVESVRLLVVPSP
jgi:biopolymer transport protein ExbD